MSDVLVGNPASHAFAVTPSDSTEILFHGLYVGGTGNVAVLTKTGASVTFQNVPSGFILPVRGTKVLSTGTTATLIVGLV